MSLIPTQSYAALQGHLLPLLGERAPEARTHCGHEPHKVGAHLSGVVFTLDTTSSSAMIISAPARQQDALIEYAAMLKAASMHYGIMLSA